MLTLRRPKGKEYSAAGQHFFDRRSLDCKRMVRAVADTAREAFPVDGIVRYCGELQVGCVIRVHRQWGHDLCPPSRVRRSVGVGKNSGITWIPAWQKPRNFSVMSSIPKRGSPGVRYTLRAAVSPLPISGVLSRGPARLDFPTQRSCCADVRPLRSSCRSASRSRPRTKVPRISSVPTAKGRCEDTDPIPERLSAAGRPRARRASGQGDLPEVERRYQAAIGAGTAFFCMSVAWVHVQRQSRWRNVRIGWCLWDLRCS